MEPSSDRPPNGPGPVLRPYALVRGRTRPTGERLDVISMVCSLRTTVPERTDLEPEHQAVLELCQIPLPVADLASLLELPLAVIRILVADLRDRQFVRIQQPRTERSHNLRLLREVADGLRRL